MGQELTRSVDVVDSAGQAVFDLAERAVKLFYSAGSSSLLPHIVLLEAGLAFVAVKVDEHSKALEGGGDFRTVNPLGYVPALLLDDGTLLTEGPAIVQYIADQVPARRLAPPNGTIERTKLQAWLNFFSSEVHKGAFGPLFYQGISEESKEVPPPSESALFAPRAASRCSRVLGGRRFHDRGRTFLYSDKLGAPRRLRSLALSKGAGAPRTFG
jgi:glutathione S-transferase